MSIVKDVNVNGKTVTDTNDLLVYLTDELKTEGGKYIAGLGFITDNYLDEFQAVKIANQKTGGRQFRQITIAPSPAGNKLSPEDYLEMGKEIGSHYYALGFQVVVTVHLDTDTTHLHLAVNTVNFHNGFDDIYIINAQVDVDSLTLQEEEVKDVRYADIKEIFEMIDSGDFIPYKKSFISLIFELSESSGVHDIKQ